MHAVLLSLPTLRAKERQGQAPPQSMEELYSEVEDFLAEVSETSIAMERLSEESFLLKTRLLELVDALETEREPISARELTLAALTAGMFAGALDGTLLFAHQEHTKQPTRESTHDHLKPPSRLLWENLARVLETGQTHWCQAHVDDLQLLSAYGRHENRRSLDEGEQLEEQSRPERAKFQGFLLAGFKGGYAMGVVDAAVMLVGGERPGAPPKEP